MDVKLYDPFILSLMQEFQCPVCLDYMTPPIRQCTAGHEVCFRCFNKVVFCPICQSPKGFARPLTLEWLYDVFTFPCRYRSRGCTSYIIGAEMRQHENICNYTTILCPFAATAVKCRWRGNRSDVLEHCKESHQIREANYVAFIIALREDRKQLIKLKRYAYIYTHIYTYEYDSNLTYMSCFGIHPDGRLFAGVFYFGPEESIQKYKFLLIFKGKNSTSKGWKVETMPIVPAENFLHSGRHLDNLFVVAHYIEVLKLCGEDDLLKFVIRVYPKNDNDCYDDDDEFVESGETGILYSSTEVIADQYDGYLPEDLIQPNNGDVAHTNNDGLHQLNNDDPIQTSHGQTNNGNPAQINNSNPSQTNDDTLPQTNNDNLANPSNIDLVEPNVVNHVESNNYNVAEPNNDNLNEPTNDNLVESSNDNDVESRIDTDAESSIDTDAESSSDPYVELSSDPDVESSIDNDVESNNDNDAELNIDNDVESSIDSDVESSIDNDVQSSNGNVVGPNNFPNPDSDDLVEPDSNNETYVIENRRDDHDTDLEENDNHVVDQEGNNNRIDNYQDVDETGDGHDYNEDLSWENSESDDDTSFLSCLSEYNCLF